MNRRDFLVGTVAASAVLGINSIQLTNATAAVKGNVSGPKLGLTTYVIGYKWTLDELEKNLSAAGISGLELRTDMKYAHGVELTINAEQRREIRQRFKDSPITLVGLACSERFDSPDPAKLENAIEKTKQYLQLSADLGTDGLRVFPNDFQKNVPKEKTLEQIIESLRKLAKTADDLGQEICLEAHGNIGTLPNLRQIAEAVHHKRVRIMLNSDLRDIEGKGLEANLQLVSNYLAGRVHVHNLADEKYGQAKFYERQYKFLKKCGWSGWCLLEIPDSPKDRLAKLKEMKDRWNEIVAFCQL